MKFKALSEGVRTVVILGAGATYGDDTGFPGDAGLPKPPLDRDFLETLALHGPDLSPDHATNVLNQAADEFGSYYGVSLEQLFTRVEARTWLRDHHLSGVDRHGTNVGTRYNFDLAAATDQATRSIKLAIRDVLNELCQQALMDHGVSERSKAKGSRHEALAARLAPGDSVISFNYDTWIDHAIKWRNPGLWAPENRMYGTGCQVIPTRWARRKGPVIGDFKLLKLHGSTHFRGVERPANMIELVEEPGQNDDPLLIPPTYNKDIQRFTAIDHIWNMAAVLMTMAEAVVVIGYSAPSADYKAHALLATREDTPLRLVMVVNPSERDAQRVLSLFRNRMGRDTLVFTKPHMKDLLQVTN